MKPQVSIIIPAHNEEKTIKKCIESLQKLNYPRESTEIIIVDDNSGDDTGKIIDSYNLTKIVTDGVGPSGARNMALEKASGEFIAFTDADCIVHPEWINELLKGFLDEKIAGVGGSQESPSDETEFGTKVQDYFVFMGFICEYTKDQKRMCEANHSPTCNVMYRKHVLSQVNGFEEGLWPGEDVELDYRIKKAGYRLMNNPNAIVYHYRPDTMEKFRGMMRRYGFVQAYLAKKYGPFRAIQYVPFIILATFLLALIIFYLNTGLALTLYFSASILTCFFILHKSKYDPGRTISNLRLSLETLVYWNYGFIEGLLEGK